jgi:Holliday junction resolvase
MSAANKAKGSAFERDIENYINEVGIKARRLPRAGTKDIGDVAIELASNRVLVVEAKNRKTQEMSEWLREADIEACNYDLKYKVETYPVVITKTRQKGIGEARVTMTVDTLINLLKWEGLT